MGVAREAGIERDDGPVQLTAEDEVPVYVPAGQAALGDMRGMPRTLAAQCQPVQPIRSRWRRRSTHDCKCRRRPC